jgi:hypothetical protein
MANSLRQQISRVGARIINNDNRFHAKDREELQMPSATSPSIEYDYLQLFRISWADERHLYLGALGLFILFERDINNYGIKDRDVDLVALSVRYS